MTMTSWLRGRGSGSGGNGITGVDKLLAMSGFVLDEITVRSP